ncbi:hypothetical protein BH10CYA1_BH10CYA1_42810 [soil metagenome]
MRIENQSEQCKFSETGTQNTSLLPSVLEFQNHFQFKQLGPEPKMLEFSSNIYGQASETICDAKDDKTGIYKNKNFDDSSRSLMANKANETDSSNFRSNFKAADDAAKAAFKEMYSSSQLQTAEYGARLYFDPKTKTYGYTGPNRFPEEGEKGYNEKLDPLTHAPIGEPPKGTVPHARLHTHVQDNGTTHGMRSLDPQPKSVSAKIISADHGDLFNLDPNRFSSGDLVNAKGEHVFSYVATPNGSILRYDPNTNRVSPAGSVEK